MSPPPKPVPLRLGPAHAHALAELEALCFDQPWSEKQLAGAFAQASFAAFGLFADGLLLAYVSLYLVEDEIEIINVATRPEHRKKGLARRLLGSALQAGRKMGIQKARLEVRKSNAAAIALYASLGFKRAGARPRYYANNEDALIYVLELENLVPKAPETPNKAKDLAMRKIIAANWKMNKIRPEAAQYAASLALALAQGTPEGRLAIVFPPYTDIATVADAFSGINNLAVGGQNFYPAEKGAYTGEISCAMLRDAGANWALAGHSERRHIFGESDELIAKKTAFGLDQGFKIMLCVGETLEERNNNHLQGVLERQISTALQPLGESCLGKLPDRFAIAYEPVWAIGTGKVAGPEEIRDAHAATRKILRGLLGGGADATPILYGGSVNPGNASSILKLDNVDGLLVGGASLEADSFLDILRA